MRMKDEKSLNNTVINCEEWTNAKPSRKVEK